MMHGLGPGGRDPRGNMGRTTLPTGRLTEANYASRLSSCGFLEFLGAPLQAGIERAQRRHVGRISGIGDRLAGVSGLTLTTIRPHDVATYIETRQLTHSAPDVKQQLAAVRMLFDWLITGQIVPVNPAAAVRGPKHVVKTGKTAVLDAKEWRKLLDSIPTDTLRDRRDRALIATLTYSFARINAALKMKVEDLRPKGAGWQFSFTRKAASST